MATSSSSTTNNDHGTTAMMTAMAPSLSESNVSKIPKILPHERVFPIQIGSELFKLSGASLSSDAPSYFSQYFRCQIENAEETGADLSTAIKTLYIDRDPATFKDIALHLQGYHVQPKDGTHFVRLFADAQFYSLPKLISQLYEESIFISIGHREFQIPRDILTDPGNSPNYFSLGFGFFFARRDDELFPGLDREGLIRPPSILPPSVPNRSADVFADLLRLLRGYPVRVRDEAHREDLLRDARYFHFKGLEQSLVPHEISYNQIRGREEIVLRLENVQKSGVSVPPSALSDGTLTRWVNYARPYVEGKPAELVLEIGGERTRIHFPSGGVSSGGDGAGESPRAEFFNDTKVRVAKLFEVIATKLNLSPTTHPLGLLMATGGAISQPATPGTTPLSEELVRVSFEPESAIVLDGRDIADDLSPPTVSSSSSADTAAPETSSRKRRRGADGSIIAPQGSAEQWTVRTGQWRVKIQPAPNGKSGVECVLVAVKIDALSTELSRNSTRGFLSR